MKRELVLIVLVLVLAVVALVSSVGGGGSVKSALHSVAVVTSAAGAVAGASAGKAGAPHLVGVVSEPPEGDCGVVCADLRGPGDAVEVTFRVAGVRTWSARGLGFGLDVVNADTGVRAGLGAGQCCVNVGASTTFLVVRV